MTTNAPVSPNPADKGITSPPQGTPPMVDLSKYVIEDGEPVESWYAGKQYRLLEDTLYVSWPEMGQTKAFEVATNVGLFGAPDQIQALCPDVMVGVDILLDDMTQRRNRSWFVWERGKAPDIVIEIVSDTRGGEGDRKHAEYARIGVPYYVIFDPENRLREGVLRSFVLRGSVYERLADNLYPAVGLGLVVWRGRYDNANSEWIRWCDLEGNLIPTGAENRERSRVRIDQAERERQLAIESSKQAERERLLAIEHAEKERVARERLEAKLRALGIDPNA